MYILYSYIRGGGFCSTRRNGVVVLQRMWRFKRRSLPYLPSRTIYRWRCIQHGCWFVLCIQSIVSVNYIHMAQNYLVKLFDCQRDVTSYLKRLGLKCGQRQNRTEHFNRTYFGLAGLKLFEFFLFMKYRISLYFSINELYLILIRKMKQKNGFTVHLRSQSAFERSIHFC